jgi:hypothetical protein
MSAVLSVLSEDSEVCIISSEWVFRMFEMCGKIYGSAVKKILQAEKRKKRKEKKEQKKKISLLRLGVQTEDLDEKSRLLEPENLNHL